MQGDVYIRLNSIINNYLSEDKTIIIAIDGNCCSGKSTLASYMASKFDCNVFHMDDFFLRPEQKTKERLKEAGGNVDYIRFKDEVLNYIKKGIDFRYQIYDCTVEKLTNYVKVFPKKLNIVEGVYSMHPALESAYDLKIFLQIHEKTQIQRILKRNGKYILQRFLREWIPLENEYFSRLGIIDKCDIVINTDFSF